MLKERFKMKYFEKTNLFEPLNGFSWSKDCRDSPFHSRLIIVGGSQHSTRRGKITSSLPHGVDIMVIKRGDGLGLDDCHRPQAGVNVRFGLTRPWMRSGESTIER